MVAKITHGLEDLLGPLVVAEPHQGRNNVPLTGNLSPPGDAPLSSRQVGCRKRLGGLLRHYHCRAA
jgi:hypothetical protein